MATPLVDSLAGVGPDPALAGCAPEDVARIMQHPLRRRRQGLQLFSSQGPARRRLRGLACPRLPHCASDPGEPQPLDLLITDIVMPNGVNGFALARMARMRRLDLNILYLTAFDLPAEEAGGKIVRKPIPLELLVLEARRALAGKCDPRA